MYAIRSYYETRNHVTIAFIGDIVGRPRITSYNVCYTKLLRYLKVKEGEYERYGRSYSVVFFDLDHFKKVNDTYGHEAGDAVLAAFGGILRDISRNVDVIGRYGGEEFLRNNFV